MEMNLTKLTLQQLVLSNVHIGHNLNFLTYKVKPYLLGKRRFITILNLGFTLLQLKNCINIITKLITKRQKILITKEVDLYNTKRLFFRKKFGKYVIFYDKKWLGGLLTNFRVVRESPKLFKKGAERVNIQYMRYLPSFVFISDPNLSKWILHEAYNLQIPTASVIDSNSEYLEIISYPLIGNNGSYESIYFFICIIRNAILRGIKKEYLKLLKIKRQK